MASPAPALRSFNLALVQLGRIGSDKTKNIAHAREQVRKAASREDGPKPQLIVLPVSRELGHVRTGTLKSTDTNDRSVSTPPTAPPTSPRMRRQLGTTLRGPMIPLQARATPSRCSQPLPRRLVFGWSGVCAPYFTASAQKVQIQGTGSIPEREVSTGNLYNTATVYSPQGLHPSISLLGRCR